MATFYNQASLTLGGNITNSNITVGEIIASLSMTKTAASADYGPGDGITYVVSLVNAGSSEQENLTVTDDLGAYSLDGGTTTLTPLTYIEGSVLYYVDGVLQPAPTVEAGPPLTISGISVPAGGNAIIIYEARANSFAPLSQASSIFNTATVSGSCEELSDSAAVPTRDEASLTIAKSISPEEIANCGGEVTYTLIIQNTGNTPVVATDNLIINDTFNPILTDITVTLNGETLTEGTGYTYDEATGQFSTLEGAVPVPAATFSRDPVTGIVTTTPGVAIITITGNLS